MNWSTLILFAAVVLKCLNAQVFRLPERQACVQRKIHLRAFGKNYHFSWVQLGHDAAFTWEQARNYCRRFCMDAISFDSPEEYRSIKEVIKRDNVEYIWTGGRLCNFAGCARADLQPAILRGWFWASTGARIAAPGKCAVCDWSNTGGIGQVQPDNREFRTMQNGEEEACIAVLNDVYQDGIRWHDVACSHAKPVICQDETPLLKFANVL